MCRYRPKLAELLNWRNVGFFMGRRFAGSRRVGIDKDEVEEGGGPERGEFEGAVSSFSSARFPRQSSVQTAREWTADFCALARNSKAR